MSESVLDAVESVGRHRCTALREAIELTLRDLRSLLRLDEYHRHGHEPEQLGAALGPVGARQLDLGTLSRVLGESTRSRAMTPTRRKRVEQLLETLEGMRRDAETGCTGYATAPLADGTRKLLARADAHFESMAKVFRALRIAQLEARAKYEPGVHDPLFEQFSWRQLGPAELRLCPPFVVTCPARQGDGELVRQVLDLLEPGQPLKIALFHQGFDGPAGSEPGPAHTSAMALETLPLALRDTYFLQLSTVAKDFEERVFAALTAPRAAVVSVLCPRPDEETDLFRRRADRALRSRAFPFCLFDPDRARGFVSCLDLSANPFPEQPWTMATVAAVGADGRPGEVVEPFTFAHFAAGEEEFENGFRDPSRSEIRDGLTPLHEFLELSPRQRVGKVPTIAVPGPDGTPRRRVPSPSIVSRTAQRAHLWQTLQEIAGLDNPHIHEAREKLQAELGVQQKALVESLQSEMEEQAAHREQIAVAAAVRRLVANLTGVDPGSLESAPPAEESK